MASNSTSLEGGCTCRHVRYRMTSRPLFVHCCHCRWCQRETGASFALNAMIEADRVPPVIHIFTMSKPDGTPAVKEYYQASKMWPKESLERRTALQARRA